MKILLLPVKDFNNAKQRLAGTLAPEQRAGLARAMLQDVLAAISGAHSPQRVILFTGSADVAETARSFPFEIINEDPVQGHSHAVNRMVEQLTPGASQILSIAGDLPTITAQEIDQAFLPNAESPGHIRLFPSRDGTGTNGALFVLPATIRMEYGEHSLARHLVNGKAAGWTTEVVRIPGIEFDVDTAADLDFFLRSATGDSATRRYLEHQ